MRSRMGIMARHIQWMMNWVHEMMDYNRSVMYDIEAPHTRRRTIILAIVLATIPCYCLGFITLSFAPDVGTTTPTGSVTVTGTPQFHDHRDSLDANRYGHADLDAH